MLEEKSMVREIKNVFERVIREHETMEERIRNLKDRLIRVFQMKAHKELKIHC